MYVSLNVLLLYKVGAMDNYNQRRLIDDERD